MPWTQGTEKRRWQHLNVLQVWEPRGSQKGARRWPQAGTRKQQRDSPGEKGAGGDRSESERAVEPFLATVPG